MQQHTALAVPAVPVEVHLQAAPAAAGGAAAAPAATSAQLVVREQRLTPKLLHFPVQLQLLPVVEAETPMGRG